MIFLFDVLESYENRVLVRVSSTEHDICGGPPKYFEGSAIVHGYLTFLPREWEELELVLRTHNTTYSGPSAEVEVRSGV